MSDPFEADKNAFLHPENNPVLRPAPTGSGGQVTQPIGDKPSPTPVHPEFSSTFVEVFNRIVDMYKENPEAARAWLAKAKAELWPPERTDNAKPLFL